MLFTDREVLTIAELESIESDVAKVISNEALPFSGPNGIMRRAMNDCGSRILARMVQFESYGYASDSGLSYNHLAAVMNYAGSAHVPKIRLQQITLANHTYGLWSPLKTWVAHCALALIYQSAWSKKVKEDKYKQKLEQYQNLAEYQSYPRLQQHGIPVVWSPLSAPAAVFEFNAGTWDDSNVTATSSPGAAGGSFDLAVTYVDETDYVSQVKKGNAESHPSEVINEIVPVNQALSVSIASLVPPDGSLAPQGLTQNFFAPRKATGWNVYAGPAGGRLVLQNATPIAITTKTYQFASDPATFNYPLAEGQYADRNEVLPNLISRG